MSYVADIRLALVRVTEQASFHQGVRLAGYAANVDYWSSEVRHVLDCIAGYEMRFRNLKDARMNYAKEYGLELDPSWITPSITGDELGELNQRVLYAATRFFRLCSVHLDHAKVVELE